MKKSPHFPAIAVIVSIAVFCTSCTPEPVAALMADKTSVVEGETVQFTDLSSNEPTVWLWEFSGGTPSVSQQQNPTVNYSTEGVYNVTLEVKNRGGSSLVVMNNYIKVEPPEPIAAFTADETIILEGEMVQFTDLSSNSPTEWLWEFSGGTPGMSQIQNPTVTYATEGTYSVSLNVTNGGGSDLLVKNNYIRVEPAGTDLTFINTTHTEILIELNGVEKTIPIGGEVTYFSLEGETVVYDAETSQKTTQGNSIGRSLTWTNRIVFLAGDVQELEMYIGTAHFFLLVRNDGTQTIGPFEVYDDDANPLDFLDVNVGLPNDGIQYHMGYYRSWEFTEVWAYLEDDSQVFWDNLTYDNVSNQEVALRNTFKKSSRINPGHNPNQIEMDNALPDTGYVPVRSTREGVIRHAPDQ